MTTVKVKLRKSSLPGKPGVLFIRLIHAQEVKQMTTTLKLHPAEWNETRQRVIIGNPHTERGKVLAGIQKQLDHEVEELNKIIGTLREQPSYRVADVAGIYRNQGKHSRLDVFMQKCISELQDKKRFRTAETYRSALHAFTRFTGNYMPHFDQIDRTLIDQFEQSLQARGITRNTSSFYMRILRSVYHKAVDEELCADKNPFRNVYTGIDQTIKRALEEPVIARLEQYSPTSKQLQFARDMFLFSFYARGMAFVDLYHLRKSDITGNRLHYIRSKTRQQLSMRIEPCMQEIIERYPRSPDGRLFPFTPSVSRNGKHTAALWLQNQRLRQLSEQLKLEIPLSTYVSRHSWASIAKRKGVPTSVISECMGHNNEATTRIYLASFEQSVIDETNKLVIGTKNRYREKGGKEIPLFSNKRSTRDE